jgi:sugar phosphate isomerase/epimerase
MQGVNTSAVEMIYALGHRLQALHIHDNDKKGDTHQIPFSMQIDFAPIVKALHDIGYQGYFTLEADAYLKNFTPENAFAGVQNLAFAAKKLAQMFEEI